MHNITEVKNELPEGAKNLSEASKISLEFLMKEGLERLVFAESEKYITPFSIIAIIASGAQMNATVTRMIKNIKEKNLFRQNIRVDGSGDTGWCIVDLSDCFVNFITPDQMLKYRLEDIITGNHIK